MFSPIYQHRILYVGDDLTLLKFLQDTLRTCRIVRAPGGSVVRTLIKGISYSLLLFEPEMTDTTGIELAQFARALPHRRRAPILMLSTDRDGRVAGRDAVKIVETIAHLLDTSDNLS